MFSLYVEWGCNLRIYSVANIEVLQHGFNHALLPEMGKLNFKRAS